MHSSCGFFFAHFGTFGADCGACGATAWVPRWAGQPGPADRARQGVGRTPPHGGFAGSTPSAASAACTRPGQGGVETPLRHPDDPSPQENTKRKGQLVVALRATMALHGPLIRELPEGCVTTSAIDSRCTRGLREQRGCVNYSTKGLRAHHTHGTVRLGVARCSTVQCSAARRRPVPVSNEPKRGPRFDKKPCFFDLKLEREGRARTRDANFLRGRGGRWAGLSSVSVRTPLRALSKRRKRRCNAPALRFLTSVLRLHLRRFAHPSDGLKTPGSLGPGAWGPGAATLACQKSRNASHQTWANEKNGKSYLDRRLRFHHTELETPLVERIPVVHLWASPT
eukprot:gene20223-biopygen20584